MPESCSAYGCTNYRSSKHYVEKKVSFHRFPHKNLKLLKEWLRRMKRQDFKPSLTAKICSEHFAQGCFTFQNFTNVRLLKKDAVPTIFDFSKKQGRKRTTCQFVLKKIGNCKIDNPLVSSTNSTPEEKEERKRIAAEALLKLEGMKEADLIETITPDKTGEGEENVIFHRPSKTEDIFGQYIASEMRTLKVDPLLYLLTKQAILETLTSANFELINSL